MRGARLAAQAVFLICLAAYVVGLAPSIYWLDSSEFAAAAFELGVAHPPGHPLTLLLGKLLTLLPLGSVALRVGLASSLAGAGAAAMVTLLGAGLARRVMAAQDASDETVAALAGAASGLGFGLGYAAAFQAVRPEVYALHALLVLGAAVALLRYDESTSRRWLWLAALLVGLALTNHHLLAGLFAIAAALFVLMRRWAGARPLSTLGGAAALGLLGLAVYAYLPLRAARHPLVDWGAPSTVERFLWTVSARAFQKSLAHAQAGASLDVVVALLGELNLLAPLALLGAYFAARRPTTRRLALFLVGAAALDAAAPALVGFDTANPDAYGYLAPAVGLCAALAAAAPAALAGLSRRRPALLRAACAALAVATGAVALPRATTWARPRFADTDRHVGALLDGAPPRALLVSSYFQSVFALWYLRVVEGRRPDVDHVHRHFLSYPGYAAELLRRRPALAPLLAERDVAAAAVVAHAGPVVLEYDLDLDDALVERSSPTPPLRLPLDEREPQTRRVLLWRDFLDASRACRRGRPDEARPALTRARALLGPNATDPELEQLAHRCHLD